MNLLSFYIASRGLNEHFRGVGVGSYEPTVEYPSKKEIKVNIKEYGDDVALPYHIKGLYDSRGKHDYYYIHKKILKLTTSHCRRKGMTFKEQAAVIKFVRMNKKQPSYRFSMYVVPNNFTKQQMQYLCAKVCDFDAKKPMAIVKENGKDVYLMGIYDANRSYGKKPFMQDFSKIFTPDAFDVKQQLKYIDDITSGYTDNFTCAPYSVHIKSQGDKCVDLDNFYEYVDNNGLLFFDTFEQPLYIPHYDVTKYGDIDQFIDSFSGGNGVETSNRNNPNLGVNDPCSDR